MMTTKRYFVLSVLLFSLCFMTQCKSDNKVEAKDTENTEAAAKKEASNPSIEESKAEDHPQKIEELTDQNPPTESKTTIPEKDQIDKKPALTKEKAEKPVAKQTKASKPKSTKPLQVRKPKIQFEELVWNFGEITEGDIIKKKFKFTNTGNAPLEIVATSATCGCTIPSFPFLDIAPGESNVIGVTYNSVNKDGEQSPEITVESNAYPNVTIIKLHGTVKPKPKKTEEKSDSTVSVKDSVVLKQ